MAYDENIYARIASGEVSQEEISALKKSGEWDEIQKILKASDSMSLPAHDKEKGFEELLQRREKVKIHEPVRRKLNPLWLGIAASLLLMVGFFFLLSNNTISVNAGMAMNEEATFPDGSSFVLNDGSKIEYDSKDWGASRNLNLTGEALFRVEKGNKFVVSTTNGDVEVLGTQFNVRSWGGNLYVECYEGSVKVTSSDMQSILVKNEAINVVDGKMLAKNNIPNSAPLWQSGNLRFHQENLTEVFRELERQYNIELEFVNEDRKFSGSFEEGNLEKALKQICDPMGLKFQIQDNNKVIITN